MKDGCRLAARIWYPEGAEDHPVPAILEYIPYRKRDGTVKRDSITHPYFAAHGYAAVRVDLRGSGDSEGLLADEYLETELADCETVLKWLSHQPWCNGKVGMYGKSWGGFNGLQMAARQPPELQAVITVCSTDDRYADDIHYMGGCLLGDNLSWASAMFALNSTPPDPEIVGDQWQEIWMERLEGNQFWLKAWLDHQLRDDFWKHGSICEDFSKVKTPVLAVSGWADGYSNAVFRLLEGLSGPRAGLIGPWGHRYPHQGMPGPAIGFLQEALRWWDRWLKDKDTGVESEPMLRAWMQSFVPPTMNLDMRPGRWVAEEEWPSPRLQKEVWTAAPGSRLQPVGSAVSAQECSVQSPLSVGLFGGKWCSFSATPDLPHDQREEDGGALVFESAPLAEGFEILGAPEVELHFKVDRPIAMVCARLSDVDPSGRATRVTYGLHNLNHVEGHEQGVELEPGKVYNTKVSMNGIAHSFPQGNRIRLSLSTSYWPIAWASPDSVTLTVLTGSTKLALPMRESDAKDKQLRKFEAPKGYPPAEVVPVRPRDYQWIVTRDLAKDVATLKVLKDEGVKRLPDIDLQVHRRTEEKYSYRAFDHNSLKGEVTVTNRFERGDWKPRCEVRTTLTCDRENFYLHADLDAYLGEERIFCKSDSYTVPRCFL